MTAPPAGCWGRCCRVSRSFRSSTSPSGGGRRTASKALPFRWSRRDSAEGLAATARADAQLRFLLLRAIQSRRKVRVAERKDIVVRQGDKAALNRFNELMADLLSDFPPKG